jgi:probable phosphoglycerate mutase
MSRAAGVLVVRHSESTFHVDGRWAGWLDPPLTAAGLEAVHGCVERWAGWPLSAVTSSDLARAAGGADRFSALAGVPRRPADSRLRERNAGAWQGRVVAELAGDPCYEGWKLDERTTPPGGEPYTVFTDRIAEAVAGLVDGPLVLAITHDGVLSALCHLFALRRPPMRPLVDAVFVQRESSGRPAASLEVGPR